MSLRGWFCMLLSRRIAPAVGQTWADDSGNRFTITNWDTDLRMFGLRSCDGDGFTYASRDRFEVMRKENNLCLVSEVPQ